MKKRIGFMGLGTMGLAMAENILKNGFALTVYNRTKNKAVVLAELGATVVATPRELAQQADVIVVMVSDYDAVASLLADPHGCAKAMTSSTLFVNMSTVSPACARELAATLHSRGIEYVDAPVCGSRRSAQEASLTVLAAGTQETIQELEPLFLALAGKIIYCGAVGQGSLGKVAMNVLQATMQEGLMEMFELAQGGGLDTTILMDILTASPLMCELFQQEKQLLHHEYSSAQYPLKHMANTLKDALDTAWTTGTTLPCATTAFSFYAAAKAKGLGELDAAAVITVLKTIAGQRTTP